MRSTIRVFTLATLERAVKTFAQALGALLIADGTDLLETAWSSRLSIAGMAALLSVLSSVASGTTGAPGPSLGPEAITAEVAKPATLNEGPTGRHVV